MILPVGALTPILEAIICFPSLKSFPNSLVIKDLTEVGPFSWGIMFQFLSIPLQNDLRFFRIPLPASLSASFTSHLPHRKRYELTMFCLWDMEGLGSAFSPVVLHLCVASQVAQQLDHFPFWVGAYQHLWLLDCDDVYQQFTSINRTFQA